MSVLQGVPDLPCLPPKQAHAITDLIGYEDADTLRWQQVCVHAAQQLTGAQVWARCGILTSMQLLPLLWRPVSEPLLLHHDEVHVWRAALDMPAPHVQSLWHTLTADERQRAERYIFEKDRTHFVVARGLLRVLLGRYLHQDPQSLRFTYGPRGKPALAADMGAGTLRFNVSHSHGLVLYAMTRGRDLGVDVERIRPDIVQEQVAERFFSPREVTLLRALPVPLQAAAFFACWTRKEAYIKSTGEGLALPLDQFDVSLAPGEPAALLRTAWDPQEAPRWTMQDLDPAPGYRAAVAVAGHGWRLTCWDGPGAYLDVSNSPRST